MTAAEISSLGDATHVLLIEDNAGDAALIEAMLSDPRHGNYRIRHCVSLEEASVKAHEFDVHIVLLDLSLPGTVGLETLRNAQSSLSEVPIIVLTGLNDDNVAIDAVRQGAQDYFVKGEVDGAPLRRSIHYGIERHRFERLQHSIYRSDRLASLGHLAASVAHEINNPAAYLLANLSVLQDNCKEVSRYIERLRQVPRAQAAVDAVLGDGRLDVLMAQSMEMLRENIEGIERIHHIANDLRMFSRSESDDAEWVRLNDIVSAACNMLQSEIRRRAVLVRTFGNLPPIPGRRGKLSQVVINLLINACHAIEEGAPEDNEIRVSTRVSGGNVYLTVEDTGCGISSSNLSRIFDPFYTTKGRTVGTGLGLPLSLETAKSHGGTIYLRSELGIGSTFELVLPLDTGLSVVGSKETDVAATGERRRRAKVLLIDDEHTVRRAFQRILSTVHEVVEAASGDDAIALLTGDDSFDVILCDLMMPGMDGPSLYAALETHAPHLKKRIIFISGGAFSKRCHDFVNETDTLVLAKPISADDLFDAISSVLGAREPLLSTS